MRKHLNILIVFIAVILSVTCYPKYASAKEDITITDWIIHAYLNESGDLNISEDITFEFNEKFNGVYRDLILSDKYGLSDIKVDEISKGGLISYKQAVNAMNGDKGVFTLEKKKNQTVIKIYTPSENETKTFKISYVINNLAVKYKDTGELYYKFLGDENKTPIGNFTVYIGLPDNTGRDKVKVFVHGPSNSKINQIINSEYPLMYKLQATEVPSETRFEARILFPPQYLSKSDNYINIDAYQKIINDETELQKSIENARMKKKFINGVLNQISLVICGIGLLMFIFTAYHSKRNINKDLLAKVFKDIPEDCTPAVAAYIAKLNSSTNVFLATLLDLFRKGYLKISSRSDYADEKNVTDYIIYKTRDEDEYLLEHERYFINWLFNEIGNGKSVSLKDIEYHSRKKAIKFQQSLSTWNGMIKKEADKRGYLDHSRKVHGYVLIIISIISLFLGFITAINGNLFAVLNFGVGFVLLFYGLYLPNRLTDKGYIQSMKWRSFAKYMRTHNPDISAHDIIDTLERPLIYALSLGIIKKQILTLAPGTVTEDSYVFWYALYADSSSNSFNNSINNSFTDSSFSSGGVSTGSSGGAGGGGAGGF